MPSALIQITVPLKAALPRDLAAPTTAKVAADHKTSPRKTSVESAWAAWAANFASSSGCEFLQLVASWMDGTAAQLLRPRWPAGMERPTPSEVRERLRHNLGLAVRGGHSDYLEALGWARDAVIEELRQAQGLRARPIPIRACTDDHHRRRQPRTDRPDHHLNSAE